jgi:hypothetical protein
MALLVVGIDEAGYGPLLGPLCVGVAALRVEAWAEGDGAPEWWSLLEPAVCRKAGDRRGRVAVDDSKKLKLPNDGARHPLTHLERGVLAFMAAAGARPASESDLLSALGAKSHGEWYDAPAADAGWSAESVGEDEQQADGRRGVFPVAHSPEQIGIAANRLGLALAGAGVAVERLACRVIAEEEFNATVRREGTKAAATALAIGEAIRWAWARGQDDGELHVRVVCDRQGGRTDYEQYVGAMLPGAVVRVLEQGPERARYAVQPAAGGPGGEGGGGRRGMIVQFQTEAESAHLPVALASMTAKLVRETLMGRFNRYWCSRLPELKPTAGYAQDGRRWLNDLRGVLTPAERERLVRIA